MTSEETVKKPENLSWEEAAVLPGAALTGNQALFVHVNSEMNAGEQEKRKEVLVTDVSGGVVMYLMQFCCSGGISGYSGHELESAERGVFEWHWRA